MKRCAALLGVLVAASLVPLTTASAQAPRPNIVIIYTDDQRWDTISAMNTVQQELVAKGVTFPNGFVVNALCCPSRASLLTGQYSHSTGVWTNRGTFGGFASFKDSSTVATWLKGAGYQTALIGKYLNGYKGTYVPPGWDRWVAYSGGYFNYTLNIDGTERTFGSAASDYSTDVLAAEAVSFIEKAEAEKPLFLEFTPFASHGPATPAPRHVGAFSGLPPWRPPSYNEADVSDKPDYIRSKALLTRRQSATIDAFRKSQYESLLAVDEAVSAILAALGDRLANTMIVFASDNGYLWGEHRRKGKMVPYEESIRIPYVVRYDPLVRGGSVDDHLVLNIDLAPTFAELAGVGAPGADGTSLLPLLSPEPTWRSDFLVEHLLVEKEDAQNEDSAVPTHCAVRSRTELFVRYSTGEEELYDLPSDPYQLQNRADDRALEAELTAMRDRARRLCDPLPPDMPAF